MSADQLAATYTDPADADLVMMLDMGSDDPTGYEIESSEAERSA